MVLTSQRLRVQASVEEVWSLLLEKLRSPGKFVPGVTDVRVLEEFGEHSITREMTVGTGARAKIVRERITADPVTRTVIFKLQDDPVHTGFVVNTILEEHGDVLLDYTLHWTLREPGADPVGEAMKTALRDAIRHTKALAEDLSAA